MSETTMLYKYDEFFSLLEPLTDMDLLKLWVRLPVKYLINKIHSQANENFERPGTFLILSLWSFFSTQSKLSVFRVCKGLWYLSHLDFKVSKSCSRTRNSETLYAIFFVQENHVELINKICNLDELKCVWKLK